MKASPVISKKRLACGCLTGPYQSDMCDRHRAESDAVVEQINRKYATKAKANPLEILIGLLILVAVAMASGCVTHADIDPLERRVLELERRQRMADACEPEPEPQPCVKEQRA